MHSEVTPGRVITLVAFLLHTTPEAILSPRRQEPVRTARNLCAHVMRRHIPSMTYREIASALGRADHSTPINSVRRVDDLLATDTGMVEIVAAIERGLAQTGQPTDPGQMVFAWMLTSGSSLDASSKSC